MLFHLLAIAQYPTHKPSQTTIKHFMTSSGRFLCVAFCHPFLCDLSTLGGTGARHRQLREGLAFVQSLSQRSSGGGDGFGSSCVLGMSDASKAFRKVSGKLGLRGERFLLLHLLC